VVKFSPITWQTAGVTIATSPLTLNFTTGLTGSVSASTMTVGIAAPAAPVVSQIYPLMVQSAWRPSTNMPTLEAGYQGWELQFHRTNAAGANVNLYSHWHFTTPTNYVTNSLQLRLWSTILSTNGPNNSNVIWRAQILRGGATGTNDIRVGAFASSESVTQTWTQTYFGTNLAQTAVITCTNGNIGAGDFGILKLTRDNVNDTYTGSSSLVGAQLEFRTQ